MRIYVNEINDPVAFQQYFNADGPTREVNYFLAEHTKELGHFRSPVVPTGGDPFLFKVEGKVREYAIVMLQWDASGEEMSVRLMVMDVLKAEEDDGAGCS